MGHIFYTTLSIVYHFKAISEFKLEFKSGNAQFRSKTVIFCLVWPWNLMDDLENNRASLLCYFKLCASFHGHPWIETGVTVRKRPIWVKIDDYFSRVTLKFDRWPVKTIGHLLYATSSFVHHSMVICEFKLELQSRNGYIGFWPLWPWPLTSDLDLLSPDLTILTCTLFSHLSPFPITLSSDTLSTLYISLSHCTLIFYPYLHLALPHHWVSSKLRGFNYHTEAEDNHRLPRQFWVD